MVFNSDKQINVRMSYELYSESKELADKSGWTIAAWIRKAMEEKIIRDTGRADSTDKSIRSEIDEMKALLLKHEKAIQNYTYAASSSFASEKEDYIKPVRRV